MNAYSSSLVLAAVSSLIFAPALHAQGTASTTAPTIQTSSSMAGPMTQASPLQTASASQPLFVQPGQLHWVDHPTAKGVKRAYFDGNPKNPGPVTYRNKIPANYQYKPHQSSVDLRFTVLSGDFNVGIGNVFDRTKTHRMGPGAYFMIPHDTPYYAWSRNGAIVQIYANGPVVLKDANPT